MKIKEIFEIVKKEIAGNKLFYAIAGLIVLLVIILVF